MVGGGVGVGVGGAWSANGTVGLRTALGVVGRYGFIGYRAMYYEPFCSRGLGCAWRVVLPVRRRSGYRQRRRPPEYRMIPQYWRLPEGKTWCQRFVNHFLRFIDGFPLVLCNNYLRAVYIKVYTNSLGSVSHAVQRP
jgi:hypothetical protein